MHSVEQALAMVARAVGAPRCDVEAVPLAQALGRVLARDVRMDHDVPPFRRAAMDGVAVRAPDAAVGARLVVGTTVAAGTLPDGPLASGRAARVMTGAPVPPGADRVVPFEWLLEEEGAVRIERLPGDATHIVEPGAHVRAGAIVARAGTRVAPATVGALASAGCVRVPVAVPPSVGVLGTGSELVGVGAWPGPAQIRNSNGPTLVAQCLRAGAAPADLGFVGDEPASLREAIRAGLAHDVLLLSGGVSRGDLDLVPAALEAEGVRCVFHHWAVQPGGPLWFGVKDGTLVFGLPGNPAASFVGFEVLVVPALRARLGPACTPTTTLTAHYDGPWGVPGPRRRFRPARLATDAAGRLWARAAPWRGSGDPFGLAEGDALAALPEDAEAPADGEALVRVWPVAGPWGGGGDR